VPRSGLEKLRSHICRISLFAIFGDTNFSCHAEVTNFAQNAKARVSNEKKVGGLDILVHHTARVKMRQPSAYIVADLPNRGLWDEATARVGRSKICALRGG
jgi:hypothetical protein